MSESFPKKYWWTVLIVVPIVVAIIGLAPQLFSRGGETSDSTTTFDMTGANFNDSVTMIETQVIINEMADNPARDEIAEAIERAVNLAKTGFRDDAIEIFKSVAEKTNSSMVFNNLGALYAAEGRVQDAREAYREGLARNPEQQELRINLARLYAAEGNVDQALPLLDNLASSATVEELRKKIEAERGEYEPNNDILQPTTIELDNAIRSGLSAESDVDFFRFQAPPRPRDWLHIKVTPSVVNMKAKVSAWRPDKSLLWQNAIYGSQVTAGQDVSYNFVPKPDAQYFISVGSLGGSGAYTLKIVALGLADRHEPNDHILEAKDIAIGVRIDASMLDKGDQDFFRFRASEAEIQIDLVNKAPELKPRVSFWNHDKSLLWQSAIYGSQVTAGQNVSANFTAEPGQDYFVSVSSLGGRGDYTLTVHPST